MASVRQTIIRNVPPKYHEPLHGVATWVRCRYHRGTAHYCPVCECEVRAFRPTWGPSSESMPPKKNVRCPVCNSRPRHRLLWSYLAERTDLFSGMQKRVLHVAPELHISRRLKATQWIDYVSADIASPLVDLKFDLTAVSLLSNVFDVILCSHVLEHVPDDSKAMAELFRVLKPGGWAIIQVPIATFTESGEFRFVVAGNDGAYRDFGRTTTFEDWSVSTPEERARVFGQSDHVRIYGTDFSDRLQEVGFDVVVDPYARQMSVEAATRLGIQRDEDIYYCTKPSQTTLQNGSLNHG